MGNDPVIIQMNVCGMCDKRFTVTERTPRLDNLWMPDGAGSVYFCSEGCCDNYLYVPGIGVVGK